MGKGDQKSRRGKIHIGTFGTRRLRNKAVKATPAAGDDKKAAPKKAAKKAAK